MIEIEQLIVYITQQTFKFNNINLQWVNRRPIYRIMGIFCGCLIFAEFCGYIEIAEIKNRKIFQSRYNDEIVSEVIGQSRIIFRCLTGIVV